VPRSSPGWDGCKQGWVAVLLRPGRFQGTVVETTFDRLLPLLSDACIVGVDIPIGLALTTFRDCDTEARQRLRSLRARVFRVPPAEAYLHTDTYEAGVQRCRELTGIAFSQQAFALRRKIVEVGRHAADSRVYDVHPEVSFLEMASGASLASKTRR
jgi:predicted RNase H-like nuclease